MANIEWSKITIDEASYESDSQYSGALLGRIHCSNNGNHIALGDHYNDSIAYSHNGGATWESIPYPLNYSGDNEYSYDVLVSDDGTLFNIGEEDGLIHRYNQEMGSWEDITPSSSTYYFETGACSANGQHIVVACWDGYIYVSNDYGDSWNSHWLGSYWNGGGVDINKEGNIIYASNYSDYPSVYVSTNFGASFSKVWESTTEDIDTVAWWVSCDDSGLKAVVQFAIPTYCITTSSGGASWTVKETLIPQTTSTYSGCIDLSYDGTSIVFAHWTTGIWTSDDFGDTWNLRRPTLDYYAPPDDESNWEWFGVTFIGQSNTNIAVVNVYSDYVDLGVTGGIQHPVCFSYDLGDTWSFFAFYDGWAIPSEWHLSMSEDGNIILAASDGGGIKRPLISLDGGSNWQEVGQSELINDNSEYRSAKVNYTGQHMIISTYNPCETFVSNNYGTSWFQANLPEAPTNQTSYERWTTMSGDGKCMITGYRYYLSGYKYKYFLSFDYGSTWQNAVGLPNSRLYDIAINENGSLIIAVTYTGFYYLTDENYEWSTNGSFVNLTAYINDQIGVSSINPVNVVISETGQYIYVSTSSSPSSHFFYSEDGLLTWKGGEEVLDRTNDTSCSYNGKRIFFSNYSSISGEIFLSLDYGTTWETVQGPTSVAQLYCIDCNGTGSIVIASGYNYFYIGSVIAGDSRIKSISGVPFESIASVASITVANLKSVSGVDKE